MVGDNGDGETRNRLYWVTLWLYASNAFDLDRF